MGIILLILVATALVVGIGAAASHVSGDGFPLAFAGLFGGIGGFAALIAVSIAMPLTTTSTVMDMEAFYYENAAIYEDAVVQLKAGVPIHTDELGQGALFLESANLKQIESFAKAVNMERFALVDYNKSLRSTRHWQNSFMFGLLWANVSPDLKQIRVE